MLGRGRPFYLEVINPRNATVTNEDLREVQAQIIKESGGKVGVIDLQIVTRDSTKVLKDSASTKSKSYTCLVKLAKPVSLEAIAKLSGSENILVKQRNPTRVPRRADLVRDKVIESIAIRPERPIDANQTETDLLRVDLKTSAGTYVKEFVHGDDGRTVPCLATLFEVEAAECVELDVLEVHLDWPPALDTN
jgi:tRNA pseudouridine synthase 10